ncbi:MAG: AarF/UbiB family protein [Lentisphaeria bacterium]
MRLNRLKTITRTYRQIQRYREIAGVLFRHGYGDLANTLGLKRYIRFRFFHRKQTRPKEQEKVLSRYERIRLALEELGPTFIKFGQLLSSRGDLLPSELTVELEKLLDAVPPFPTSEAHTILQDELGRPVSKLFREFDDEPVASASIAQVHRAITWEGKEVAVKIRRPGIRARIETDLSVMHNLASFAERAVEEAQVLELKRMMDQFARMIRKELDLSLEADNIERFARCFEDKKHVRSPCVYRQYCSSQILTMEYIHGLKITRLDEYEKRGLDKKTVADRGAEMILDQVFTHGFFHADPHPGNILVLPDNVVCLLDYGIMGNLSERSREQLGALLIGFAERDEHAVTNAVFAIGGYTSYVETAELEADIANFLEDNLYRSFQDVSVATTLSELSKLLIHHDIHLPPKFFLIIKCLATLEAIGRKLIPEFNLLEYSEPFAKRLIKQRIKPGKALRDLYYTAADFRSLLRDLPTETRQLVTQFRRGDLGFKFEHTGLEPLKQTHDQVSNRIVFGMVLASLIVGSSIIVLSNVPPRWHEIPVIGLAGFTISGLMGFWLLYSIIKHGRM